MARKAATKPKDAADQNSAITPAEQSQAKPEDGAKAPDTGQSGEGNGTATAEGTSETAPTGGHPAAAQGAEGGTQAPSATNTEGADDADQTAEALLHAPGDPVGSAPVQGGEATNLPATHTEAVPEAVITVICHVVGGRRRAGRRWDEGKTTVPADVLSEADLSALEADPRFEVIRPA